MNSWHRFWGHLKTVNSHRYKVMKLCFKMGLYWQGLTHDLSKYHPVEFMNGVKFFTGKASPHVGERAFFGYSKAWLHHHNNNKHHVEYWTDISLDTGKANKIKVPTKYIAEMLCDRVAASQTYLKDKFTDRAPLEYYLSHIDENEMHNDTRAQLEKLLCIMAESGSAEMFSTIKRMVKEDKVATKEQRKVLNNRLKERKRNVQ